MPTVDKAISSEIMEKEFERVILEIVNIIWEEDQDNERCIKAAEVLLDSLDKLAELGERRIKRQVLNRIKRRVVKVLRGSTNKLLIATVRSEIN